MFMRTCINTAPPPVGFNCMHLELRKSCLTVVAELDLLVSAGMYKGKNIRLVSMLYSLVNY